MEKEKNIKVVIVEPSKPARIEVIENALSNFQSIVGGLIDCIREDGFDIIINDEGKMIDLEPNFGIYDGQDYVAGTAIFAGVDYAEGEFKSLSDQQVKGILSAFRERE